MKILQFLSKGIFVLTLCFVIATIQVSAQSSGSNSPYSRYGFGSLATQESGFNTGMAGVALGVRDNGIVNYQNPATYGDIDSITMIIDAGLSLQNCRISSGGIKRNTGNSMIDYISAAFRIYKGIGVSVGLRPYSTIGYNFFTTGSIGSKEEPDDMKTATTTYNGDGGLHQAYLGIGARVYKDLNIGANIGYLWGDYNHSLLLNYDETSINSLTRSYMGEIITLTYDFGIQYHKNITSKDIVTIGGTFGLGHNVNDDAIKIDKKTSSSAIIGADTTVIKNAFQLPMTYGVGVSWKHDNQFTIALDYTCQMWSKCKFPILNEKGEYFNSKDYFNNRHRLAAGVEYIPKPYGLKVSDHIAYRAGFALTTSYFMIDGAKGPNSYLYTLGIGFPIVNRYSNRSTLNISAQWEHIPSCGSVNLAEDYARLCLGLTFNANWFNQWKVR